MLGGRVFEVPRIDFEYFEHDQNDLFFKDSIMPNSPIDALPLPGADVAGNTSTSASLTLGHSVYGTVDSSGDQDWYAITLVAGQTYDFRLLGVGTRALPDTFLRIMDSTGVQLAFNDDATGNLANNSSLVFTATYSGTFYVSAAGFSTNTGDFLLTAVNHNASGIEFTADEVAWQLTNNFDRFFSGAGSNNIPSDHYDLSGGKTITYNFDALDAAGQTLAAQALQMWADVTGINFVQQHTTSQITFDDSDAGTTAYNSNSTNSSGVISSGLVMITTGWKTYFGDTFDSYTFETYIHELGHALGLGHGGNYNGSAIYGTDNYYLNDSQHLSIMSYMQSQYDEFWNTSFGYNTYVNAQFRWVLTPMIADVLAMSNLYGLSTTTRTGDTTYGYNSNTGNAALDSAVTLNDPTNNNYVAFTVFDNGGTDTVDMSGYSGAQRIDLNEGASSDVLGGRLNMGIAYGTQVENAYGGGGDDVITGNALGNYLKGDSGTDTIYGGDGDDTIDGGYFKDQAYGGDGDDTFLAVGTQIPDDIYGGDGTDTFDASAFSSFGLTLDLQTGVYDYPPGFGGPQVIQSVENVVGTAQNDSVNGNDVANVLTGGNGDDTLNGQSSSDTIYGGDGNDLIIYESGDYYDQIYGGNNTDTANFEYFLAMSVDLEAGLYGTIGEIVFFDIQGVENVNVTSTTNDIVTGNASANELSAGAGDDTLNGGDGVDTIYGGAGNDLLVYDTFEVFDNMYGGDDIDTLTVTWDSNMIYDMVNGFWTEQSFIGISQLALVGVENIVNSGVGDDTMIGDGAANSLSAGAGADKLDGNDGADTLIGGAGADTMKGGVGADSMVGGADNDWYYVDSSDVVVEGLGEGTTDRVLAAATYVLAAGVQVEFLSTTASAAVLSFDLTGNEVSQRIDGNAGNNRLYGGGGNDTMSAFSGNDTLNGGTGIDKMTGGVLSDWYYVDSAGDVIVELAGEGINDRALSTVDYVLDVNADIEFLSTTAQAGVTTVALTGNSLSQRIDGNDGVNKLNGLGGNDTMNGWAGTDTLNGGTGADSMNGGNDSDWYYVDDAGDIVVEGAGAGTLDRVLSTVNYTLALGVQVENLSTTAQAGVTAINLTGNDLAQRIDGNDGVNVLNGGGANDNIFGFGGNDTLNGGTGNDTMTGGSGDDWYYVDAQTDIVVESVGGGTNDRVLASVNFALTSTADIESLSTTSAAGVVAINLTGNAINQTITGNNGVNVINGKLGNDYLVGGLGADTFVFDTALGATNIDTISGYTVADDTINIDNAFFAGLANGALAAGAYAFNLTGQAVLATDHIIYETDTGNLYFDVDGVGGAAGVQFAKVSANLQLSGFGAGEFFVI
jgi:serralysin